MSVCGEIENTVLQIQRLQQDLCDPTVNYEERQKLIFRLALERDRLEQLERARLKGYKDV
jgi:hypothetical protein